MRGGMRGMCRPKSNHARRGARAGNDRKDFAVAFEKIETGSSSTCASPTYAVADAGPIPEQSVERKCHTAVKASEEGGGGGEQGSE